MSHLWNGDRHPENSVHNRDRAERRFSPTSTASHEREETAGWWAMINETDIADAMSRIRKTSLRTPVVRSGFLSDELGIEVYPKLENLQQTGSFKIRGATNFIAQLSAGQADAGVVTASSGNHAQGVAKAAMTYGIDATIVMPETTPRTKVEATRSYGATVVIDGEDYGDATTRAHEIERADGRTYVSTFDEWNVIAGQATLGAEILEEVPDCGTIVVPVGGGGLISGIALAVEHRSPDTRVVGVQANGASTVAQSLDKGSIQTLADVDTVADGIAINHLGEKPFEVIQEHVDLVLTVTDDAIKDALYDLLIQGKVLVEGAGAASVAALRDPALDLDTDDVVVPVLSGGNIDPSLVLNILETRLEA